MSHIIYFINEDWKLYVRPFCIKGDVQKNVWEKKLIHVLRLKHALLQSNVYGIKSNNGWYGNGTEFLPQTLILYS